MIISCSRRTDVPATYSAWLLKRLDAGFCTVPNPMNPHQVSRVSLRPEDVDVIVFWTKNAAPMLSKLDDIDARGYRYYFQYTLNGYDRSIEPNVPDLSDCIAAFRALARRIGAEKVIWRYDPIVLSAKTGSDYHVGRFSQLLHELAGFTRRVVISIVDRYRKTERGFRELDREGYVVERNLAENGAVGALVAKLAELAARAGLEIQSCAEEIDLCPFGVKPGKCVDNALIADLFSIQVDKAKDSGQRASCGCVKSRDIGIYDSCPAGCRYCYANTDPTRVADAIRKHDQESPSLIGWLEPSPDGSKGEKQLRLPLFSSPDRR